MKKHVAVGLANPLYLPDDIKFRVSIVQSAVFQVRSNQKRSAGQVSRVTRHETANFSRGAGALMHERYLHGGPRDQYGNPVYAGYNCVSDDTEIIQLTPYDEVTWAAGNATGNLTSDHHELCVNEGINHGRAREIAAALDAAVLHARGLPITALIQHNFWWGKNCPLLLRRDGLWAWYVNRVAFYYNNIVAFLKGGKVADVVSDNLSSGIAKGDWVITVDSLNLRKGSGTSYAILRTLPSGTGATIIDGPRTADGHTWYDIKGDFGTGWVASEWLREVDPPKTAAPEAAGWPYKKPIAPAWYAELQKKGHVIVDGVIWFDNNNEWEAVKNTGRFQLAKDGSDRVGPDIKQGERFRTSATGTGLMTGKPEAWGMTDAFTRVKLADLKPVTED